MKERALEHKRIILLVISMKTEIKESILYRAVNF